jgi:hypothetical protein
MTRSELINCICYHAAGLSTPRLELLARWAEQLDALGSADGETADSDCSAAVGGRIDFPASDGSEVGPVPKPLETA